MPEVMKNSASKAFMDGSTTALNYISPNTSTAIDSSELSVLPSTNIMYFYF